MRVAKSLVRFSLATLLLLITAIGIWLDSVVRDDHHQQRIAAEIKQLGGTFTTESVSRWPDYRWLRKYFGEAYYRDIRRISLTKTEATDDTVKRISRLKSVDQLDLSQSKITNEALQHVSRMKSLRALNISPRWKS